MSEGLQLYQKETPTQAIFWEIFEIFKNTNFEEHLRRAASVHSKSFVDKYLSSKNGDDYDKVDKLCVVNP